MSTTRRYTKLTCKIGTFYFFNTIGEDVVEGKGKQAVLKHVVRDQPLSHMKIVRDAVMAKILDPKVDGARSPRTTKQVYEYVRNRIEGPAKNTRFLFLPAPGVWIKQGKDQTMGKQHRNVKRVA